jgi:hypothetical protein
MENKRGVSNHIDTPRELRPLLQGLFMSTRLPLGKLSIFLERHSRILEILRRVQPLLNQEKANAF